MPMLVTIEKRDPLILSIKGPANEIVELIQSALACAISDGDVELLEVYNKALADVIFLTENGVRYEHPIPDPNF